MLQRLQESRLFRQDYRWMRARTSGDCWPHTADPSPDLTLIFGSTNPILMSALTWLSIAPASWQPADRALQFKVDTALGLTARIALIKPA